LQKVEHAFTGCGKRNQASNFEHFDERRLNHLRPNFRSKCQEKDFFRSLFRRAYQPQILDCALAPEVSVTSAAKAGVFGRRHCTAEAVLHPAERNARMA
jgi:hypothetical protein